MNRKPCPIMERRKSWCCLWSLSSHKAGHSADEWAQADQLSLLFQLESIVPKWRKRRRTKHKWGQVLFQFDWRPLDGGDYTNGNLVPLGHATWCWWWRGLHQWQPYHWDMPLGVGDGGDYTNGNLTIGTCHLVLVMAGITPMATLYHWDMPLGVGDGGGYTNGNLVPLGHATWCWWWRGLHQWQPYHWDMPLGVGDGGGWIEPEAGETSVHGVFICFFFVFLIVVLCDNCHIHSTGEAFVHFAKTCFPTIWGWCQGLDHSRRAVGVLYFWLLHRTTCTRDHWSARCSSQPCCPQRSVGTCPCCSHLPHWVQTQSSDEYNTNRHKQTHKTANEAFLQKKEMNHKNSARRDWNISELWMDGANEQLTTRQKDLAGGFGLWSWLVRWSDLLCRLPEQSLLFCVFVVCFCGTTKICCRPFCLQDETCCWKSFARVHRGRKDTFEGKHRLLWSQSLWSFLFFLVFKSLVIVHKTKPTHQTICSDFSWNSNRLSSLFTTKNGLAFVAINQRVLKICFIHCLVNCEGFITRCFLFICFTWLPSSTAGDLIVCSFDHLIICSCDHLIICSFDHLLIWSFAHLIICSFDHLLIWSFAHLLIWSFAHLIICSFAHLIICSFDHLLICSFDHLLIWSFAHLLIWSFAHLIICSFDHLLIWSFAHLLIWSFAHLIICSFDHLLIWSFAHLIICSFDHLIILDQSWKGAAMGWAIVLWGLRKLLFVHSTKVQPPNNSYHGKWLQWMIHTLLLTHKRLLTTTNVLVAIGLFLLSVTEVNHPQLTSQKTKLTEHTSQLFMQKVKSYHAWSLYDNFEWSFGFQRRFGLCSMNCETQERCLRPVGSYYRKVIEDNGLIADDEVVEGESWNPPHTRKLTPNFCSFFCFLEKQKKKKKTKNKQNNKTKKWMKLSVKVVLFFVGGSALQTVPCTQCDKIVETLTFLWRAKKWTFHDRCFDRSHFNVLMRVCVSPLWCINSKRISQCLVSAGGLSWDCRLCFDARASELHNSKDGCAFVGDFQFVGNSAFQKCLQVCTHLQCVWWSRCQGAIQTPQTQFGLHSQSLSQKNHFSKQGFFGAYRAAVMPNVKEDVVLAETPATGIEWIKKTKQIKKTHSNSPFLQQNKKKQKQILSPIYAFVFALKEISHTLKSNFVQNLDQSCFVCLFLFLTFHSHTKKKKQTKWAILCEKTKWRNKQFVSRWASRIIFV